ncbi:MAG: hypothetical protein WAW20_15620, partial [Anaerolineae bacterium]
QAMSDVATGRTVCRPHRITTEPAELKNAVDALVAQIHTLYPALPNARWVARRLLDGDERIIQALRRGELGDLTRTEAEAMTGNLQLRLEAA